MLAERWASICRIAKELNVKPITLKTLTPGALQVLAFMLDEEWHTKEDICIAAGNRGRIATEGTRRVRELRSCGLEIEDRRSEVCRDHDYRLVIKIMKEPECTHTPADLSYATGSMFGRRKILTVEFES